MPAHSPPVPTLNFELRLRLDGSLWLEDADYEAPVPQPELPPRRRPLERVDLLAVRCALPAALHCGPDWARLTVGGYALPLCGGLVLHQERDVFDFGLDLSLRFRPAEATVRCGASLGRADAALFLAAIAGEAWYVKSGSPDMLWQYQIACALPRPELERLTARWRAFSAELLPPGAYSWAAGFPEAPPPAAPEPSPEPITLAELRRLVGGDPTAGESAASESAASEASASPALPRARFDAEGGFRLLAD